MTTTEPTPDAVDLLTAHHRTVEQLFSEIESQPAGSDRHGELIRPVS